MDGEKTCETCRHFRRHYVKGGGIGTYPSSWATAENPASGTSRRIRPPATATPRRRKGRLNVQPPFFRRCPWPGEGHGEGGALAHRALQRQGAAVELDDVFDDGQPQAGAAVLAGAALVHPVEPLKDAALGLRGMPMPVSDTAMTACPSRTETAVWTVPPGSLYLMPLPTRLSSSSLSRPWGRPRWRDRRLRRG